MLPLSVLLLTRRGAATASDGLGFLDRQIGSWGPYGNKVYGMPYAMDTPNNAPQLRGATYFPFRLPNTETVTTFKYDNRTGTGYSSGTGGNTRARLYGANSDNTVNFSDLKSDGPTITGMESQPKWQDITFDTPYRATPGELLFVELRNVHPSPNSNYASANYALLWVEWDDYGFRGPFYKDYLPIWYSTSDAPTTLLAHPFANQCGVCILETSEGHGYGQPMTFSDSRWKWTIGGNNLVRVIISEVEPNTFPATNFYLRGWRSSGSGDLQLRIRSEDRSTLLHSENIPSSAITQTSWSGRGGTVPTEYMGPFPCNFTFTAGEGYSVELGAPSGTEYSFQMQQDGATRNTREPNESETGFKRLSDRWINAKAKRSTNNGSSWSGSINGSFDRNDLILPMFFTRNSI